MEILGTVAEILGSSMILVIPEKELNRDQVLHVFAEVVSGELSSKHGLSTLHIPKGEVRIIAKQTNGFYLAEVFRTYISSGRIVEKPPSLLSGILGGPEIIRETVEGPLSATLSNPTVPVKFSRRVEVGDRVGKE